MKKLIPTLFFIISLVHVYSQNQDIAFPHVVPMSPNAAEFTKYGDIPVSHYTGVPNINIPLYEIDVDGFKLPINLNYHASGIRVDQEASWVGLGWSLGVESRISRSVKSVDDFMNLMNNPEIDLNYKYCKKGYYFADDINVTNLDNHYQLYIDNDMQCYYNGVLASFTHRLKSDPEPDIFYYNLPNVSGKFILDKSRGAVLFDKSHNLKIEITSTYGTTSVSFKITDSEGNQYFYTKPEITKTYGGNSWLNKNIHTNSTIYDDNPNNFPYWNVFRFNCETFDLLEGPQSPYPMETSWCVSKIITNRGKEINFTYELENQYLPTQESCENYNYNSQNYLFYYKSKVVNNALRLKTIEWNLGRIEFNSSDRFDIKGTAKKLDSFSVYNFNDEIKKTFKFDYTYFNDDYSGNYLYEHVFKRLKLNNVTEYSSQNTPLNKGYSFDYYAGSFPPKNSKNVDYWGFQNGKTYGENYYVGIITPNNLSFNGVKKEANFNKAIIGTLKKIIYPTSGSTDFKFESNKTSSGWFDTYTYEDLSPSNSEETISLEVYNYYTVPPPTADPLPANDVYTFQIQERTKINIHCDLENQSAQIDPDYSYNSESNPLGKLRMLSPSVSTIYNYKCPYIYSSNSPEAGGVEIRLNEQEFILEPGTYEFTAYTPPKDVLVWWRLYKQKIILLTPGTPLQNIDAGGIRISEIKSNNNIKRFRYSYGSMLIEPVLYYIGTRAGIPFSNKCIVQVSESKTPLSTFNKGNIIGYDWVIEESNLDEDDNLSSTKYSFYNNSESEIFDDNFPDSPRYINYTNGLIKSIEKYKNTTLLEKEDSFYTSTYSSYIKAFKDIGQIRSHSDILHYHYQVEWPLKTKDMKTLFTSDGNSVVSEMNYAYNSRDLLASTSIKNSISSNMSSKEIVEQLKYPSDFNDSSSLAMVGKNMVGIPVEKTLLSKVDANQEVELSKQKTIFEDIGNGFIMPKKVQTSKGGSNLEDRLIYNQYDAKGNILEVEQANGIKISYIWGYHFSQPIAKIENLAYSSINSTLITNLQSLSDSGTEADLIVALSNLRNDFPNAMVTTYTYKPLIGVSTITDTKGYTTYYEYDSFNRLKQVKNQDGKVLSANEYNYKD